MSLKKKMKIGIALGEAILTTALIVPALFVFLDGGVFSCFSNPAVDYMKNAGLSDYWISELEPLGYDY